MLRLPPEPTQDHSQAIFETNLRNDGWKQTLSKDGKIGIFTKDGNGYGVRDQSNQGQPTADYFPAGSKGATVKIRLGS